MEKNKRSLLTIFIASMAFICFTSGTAYAAADATDNDASVTEDGTTVHTANLITSNEGYGVDSGVGPLNVTQVNGAGVTPVAGTYGELVWAGNGSYTYTLNNASALVQAIGDGESKTDSFTYTLVDVGDPSFDTSTLTITINGSNDAPVAVDDAGVTGEDATLTVAANGVLGNDTDADSVASLSVTAVNGAGASVGTEITLSSGALLTLNSDGSYVYNPNGQYDELDPGDGVVDTFEYTVSDGTASDTATVEITISGTNDAPVAVDDAGVTNEDTTLTVAANGVLGNDTDADYDSSLSVTAVNGAGASVGTEITLPSGALLTLNSDGSYVYNPNGQYDELDPGDDVTDTFEYTVNDGTASDTATVTITITGTNDVPVADNDAYSVGEDSGDTNVTATLLAGDSDPDASDTITITNINTTGTTGSVTLNSGTVTYNPNGQFNTLSSGQTTTDTFTYTVSDGNGGSATATMTITITGANDVPAADDDTYGVGEDSGDTDVTAELLAGDTDPDTSDTLTITNINTAGTTGSVTLNAGIVTYNPNGQFEGLAGGETATDTFTYTISDGNGGTDTATMTITITGANDAPTISPIGDKTINEDENTGAIDFTIGDDETAPAALTLSRGSSNPALVPVGNIVFGGSGTNRTVTVTPAGNQFGSAIITVTVEDGDGGSTPETFQLTVTSVNDAPTISAIDDKTINEDENTGAIPFTIGDIETAPAALTLSRASSNTALVPVGNIVFGGSGTNRTVTVTPAGNQFGSAIITVTVEDGDGGSAPETFQLTVTSVNDTPTISAIGDQTINEDENTGAISFTIGDVETAPAALTLSRASGNTALVPEANIVLGGSGTNRTVTVTPVGNQAGSAVITVTVEDGDGETVSESFLLTVNTVNDAPVVGDIPNQTRDEADTIITFTPISLDDYVSDIETADADIDWTYSGNTNLSVTINGSRVATITAPANWNGAETITFRATDKGDGASGALFVADGAVFTINPVNDAPVVGNIPDETKDETDAIVTFTPINLDDYVNDIETADAAIIWTYSGNTNLSVTIDGSRVVTITAPANWNGSETITFRAADTGDGASGALFATDSAVFTINSQNDMPLFTIGSDQTVVEDEGAQTVTGWATGIDDGDLEVAQTLKFNITNSNSALFSVQPDVDETTGTLTYTPAGDMYGTAIVTISLTDDNTAGGPALTTTDQTFTITVNPINDPPVFTAGPDISIHEDEGAQSIAGWATGISAGPPSESGQILTFTVTGNTNPGIFADGPYISSDGTLSFSPSNVTDTETATITVTLSDDGGGTDTSAPQTFTITVRAVYNLTISFTSTSSRTELATVTAGAGSLPGSISSDQKVVGTSGTFKYEDGDTVSITAEGLEVSGAGPRIGTEFINWVVISGSYGGTLSESSPNNSITINSDLVLEVKFIGKYILTSIHRDGGTISPGSSGDGTHTIVYHGATFSFTITPGFGNHIADVVVDGFSEGPPPSPASPYPRTFNNIIVDHEIIAVFGDGTTPFTPPSSAGDDQVYTTSVPPSVMLVMSKDHKLFYKAYDDYSDLDDDGQLDTTYVHDIPYYGYFDPNKVYKYYSTPTDEKLRYFYPVRVSVDGKPAKTSGNPADGEWSGNFLNWVAMARMDAMRKVFYGGYRSVDSDTETILQRTFLPQDAHSWVKIYTPSTATGSTDVPINFLVPQSLTSISFCNTTKDGYDKPPIIRVAKDGANGPWVQWASNERWQCACDGEHSNDKDDLIPNKTTEWIADYTIRVKVAVNQNDVNGNSLIGTEKVKQYPNGNIKPVGLLQTYGEAGKINFGLISGSYTKNKSGGVLRKNIGPITGVSTSTDEIESDTGKFITANKGIISTLNNIKIARYSYSDGTYNSATSPTGDNCIWGKGEGFTDGQCSNWGNPISEMYYEALRYFSNKNSPTSDFYSATMTVDTNLGLSAATWGKPYSTDNYCSRPFIMVISDVSPSFDSDQLPGSAFGSFTGTLGSLDVDAETDIVGADEGIVNDKYFFVGQIGSGSTPDNKCTAKDGESGLGETRGICPGEPARQGSYYLAGLSYWAKKNDIIPASEVADGDFEQNVETFSIALNSPLPELNLDVGGSPVKIMPTCYNNHATEGKNNCSLVHFQIENQTATSGQFYINWEDSAKGGDYDMDTDSRLYYEISGTTVTFKIEVKSSSTPYVLKLGYIVSGTTEDGVHYIADNSDDTWITSNTCSTYSTATDTFCGMKLHTVQTSTPAATNLKDPLWYAAKWGAFKDVNDNDIPDLESEWDENNDGTPDTYYRVTNPLRLEHQLNESFKDILSRGVSHVAPVVSVDEANRTQSGDDLYMAFFKPEDDSYWKGNLKRYGLDLLIRNECSRTEREWTVTDSQTVTDAQGTHRKIAADCEGAFFASSISYWTDPLLGGDGGFVDRGGAGALLLNTLINIGSSSNPDAYHLGRNILTYKGASDGSVVDFNRTNISSTDLTVGSNLYRDKLINFMYGYTNDANTNGTPKKKRPWILGDIIHSEPRLIDYYDEDGTLDYRFVAVGSNDGMLHVFNDFAATIDGTSYASGAEVAAFVPADLLTKIKDLGNPGSHTYMVDGSPVLYRSPETDTVSGYKYKTLIFGERRGGRSYWMLDVTSPDPDDWKVKRHIQGGALEGVTTVKTTRIEELGYTWSKPVFTRIRTSASDIKEVVIFTGGYDPTEDSFPEEFMDTDEDGKWDSGEPHAAFPGGTEGFDAYNPGKNSMGRGIFVMDIETGDILFKVTYGNTDVTTGTDQKFTSMKYCFPADPSVITFSEINMVIYSADIYGQIWKINFNYNAPSKWKVQRVFTSNPGYTLASGSTNITSAVENTGDSGRKTFYSPDVAYYGNEWTDYPVLYFGTGDREHPKSTMISDRFYVVNDTGTLSNEGDLLNLTCDELDVDADIATPEGHDANDETIQDELKNLLLYGSAKGYYRILDKQGDCFSGIDSHVGEKVLSKPTLFAENIYFTTYQPVLGEPCNPLGNAYIYALDYSFGKSAFNYDTSNDEYDGKILNLEDSYRKITESAIPSGVRVIMREGEAAGFVSAGGDIVGAGEEGSTSIPGPPGGIARLIWKTE